MLAAPRRGPRRAGGFSFIEMVTVVAIIAVIASAAAPVASSLYKRRRELLLRETLMVLRQGIREFSVNQRDDDADGEIDEDPRGDQNRDGFPGLRGVDDNGDLLIDVDWKGRFPFEPDGSLNPDYDWRLRADDDEDMSRDEETYPSDLFDLVNRVNILRGRIPRDPTTMQPTWRAVYAPDEVANNDLDWFRTSDGTFDPSADHPVLVSKDDHYDACEDVCIGGDCSGLNTCGGPTFDLSPLIDEDPRNGLDDDMDGRRDEDAADLADLASQNSRRSTNLTTYSNW